MSKSLRSIIAGLVIVGLIGTGVFALSKSNNAPSWLQFGKSEPFVYNGGFYEPPREMHDLINAVDQNGEPFSFADHAGKVIFVYFGYTNCPDACPATVAEWREVKALLGDEADNVVFAMITVDPERDSPERMKEWLSFWDPSFYGISMPPEDTQKVTELWGITAIKRDAGSQSGYLVDHDVSTYVIGPDGLIHLTYPLGFPPEDIVEDIQHLQSLGQ